MIKFIKYTPQSTNIFYCECTMVILVLWKEFFIVLWIVLLEMMARSNSAVRRKQMWCSSLAKPFYVMNVSLVHGNISTMFLTNYSK